MDKSELDIYVRAYYKHIDALVPAGGNTFLNNYFAGFDFCKTKNWIITMRIVICIAAFIYFQQDSSAQPATYKDSVDLLLDQTRKGNKVYSDKDAAAKRLYFFNKKKKQIVTAVLAPTGSHSAYHFHFINNELVKIIFYLPYSVRPESKGKPMNGIYYLRNGSIAYKIEINFPELDVEAYRIQGIELYDRAVQFLKYKGVD